MRAAFVSIQLMVLLAIVLATGCGGDRLPPIQSKPMPEGGTFTGVWFSPQYGEMHIQQTGSSAVGRYTKDEREGRIQGQVEGDVMRFEWTEERELIVGRPVETKGHGYFRIVKDDVENTWKIVGEWGHDDADRGGGPWNAVKSKSRKPELGGEGGDTTSGSDSSGGDEGYGGRDVTDSEAGPDDLSDL